MCPQEPKEIRADEQESPEDSRGPNKDQILATPVMVTSHNGLPWIKEAPMKDEDLHLRDDGYIPDKTEEHKLTSKGYNNHVRTQLVHRPVVGPVMLHREQTDLQP